MTVLESLIDTLAESIAEKVAARLLEPREKVLAFPTDPPKRQKKAKTLTGETSAEQCSAVPAEQSGTPEQPVKSEEPPASEEKIETVVLTLVRAVGRERTIEILSQYGVKKASQLSGNDLKGFIAAAQDEIHAFSNGVSDV